MNKEQAIEEIAKRITETNGDIQQIEVVIWGSPPDETDDYDPEVDHNCDKEGCPSVGHVLYSMKLKVKDD